MTSGLIFTCVRNAQLTLSYSILRDFSDFQLRWREDGEQTWKLERFIINAQYGLVGRLV